MINLNKKKNLEDEINDLMDTEDSPELSPKEKFLKPKSKIKKDINFKDILANINSMGKKTVKDEKGYVVPDNSADNYTPDLPEVNLLPGNVKEVYAAEDLGKKVLLACGATIAVFGILFGVSIISDNIYKSKVESYNAEISSYHTEISSLKAYSDYRAMVESKRTEISGQMANQVDIGKLANDFNKYATDSGYTTASISVSLSAGAEALAGSCVNPNPFAPAEGIGCVTFTLATDGKDGSLSKLYENLNKKENGFLNVYIPSSVNGVDGSTMDGSVAITDKFYMNKYKELELSLDEATAVEQAVTEEGN